MERQAVILAGGLGTRLRGVIDDIPKSMAPVAGIPFLSYLLDQLAHASFSKVVLAVGYRHESIISFYGTGYKNLNLEYSIEDEPLGTGGAILKASSLITSESFFVFNGDTLFDAGLLEMEKFFNSSGCTLAVALKPMKNFERYGTVLLEGDIITQFVEKKHCTEGLINGGVYIVNKKWLNKYSPGSAFSFERDLMEKRAGEDKIYGFVTDGYFIDIGVPSDYQKAGRDLPGMVR